MNRILSKVDHAVEHVYAMGAGDQAKAVAGAAQADHLHDNDLDDGLAYYLYMTSGDEDLRPHTTPTDYIHWVSAQSPVVARMLKHVVDEKTKDPDARILLMVDAPWAQQWVAAIMVKLGFHTLNIRANSNAMARNHAVA